jgi:transposase
MAMGTRQGRQRQEEFWIATATLARPASHPFYESLNRLLDECRFDEFVESVCAPFYADRLGRSSLAPGLYFRMLLVGYFEGIDSERGIAWRAADSLGIRAFLGIALDEYVPDHSTISWTRRLIDLETHQLVFAWIVEILAEHGLVRGKTIGSQCSVTQHRAPRYGGTVPGVSQTTGPGIRNPDTYARPNGATGPQANQEGATKNG